MTVGIEDVSELADLNAIKQHILVLEGKQEELDSKLDRLISIPLPETRHESLLQKLGSTMKDLENLDNVVSSTALVARQISGKVRVLDEEQTRVLQVLRDLEQEEVLSESHQVLREFMAAVDRNSVSDTLLDQVSEAISIIVAKQGKVGAAKEQFVKCLSERLSKSIEDPAATISTLKMFVKANETNEAVDICLNHTIQVLKRSSTLPAITAKEFLCVDILTRYLEVFADLIERQLAIFKNASIDVGNSVFEVFEKEALNFLDRIIDTYKEQRELDRKLVQISTGQVDMKQVALAVEELVLMSQKVSLFRRFIMIKSQQEFTAKLLLKKMKEFLSINYIPLESFFLQHSLKRAVKESSSSPDNGSMFVEDSFYLCKNVLSRAIKSEDEDTICVALNLVSQCLDIDYLQNGLLRMLQMILTNPSGQQEGFLTVMNHFEQNYLQNGLLRMLQMILTNPSGQQERFLTVMNHFEQSHRYLFQLCEQFEESLNGSVISEKVVSCLFPLKQTLSQQFDNQLKSNLANFYKQQIKPRVKSLMVEHIFGPFKFKLNDNEFSDSSELNVLKFTSEVENFLNVMSVLKVLDEPNMTLFIGNICEHVSREYEKFLLAQSGQKEFNALGALKFDKDLRLLVQALGRHSKNGVKEWFSRLFQMAELLNASSAEEFDEIFLSQTIFNANELPRLKALRFSK
ncbi:hypothetical protein MP638_005396 [Amoeboaphelidium occidentale]|nr:hypothetical protein MP638_005396 [Amoeboaphelidium occidentale]